VVKIYDASETQDLILETPSSSSVSGTVSLRRADDPAPVVALITYRWWTICHHM